MPPLNSFTKTSLIVALSQAIAMPLHAAEILVDSADPAFDINKCNLRAAIISANTDTAVDSCVSGGGDDIISFSSTTNGGKISLNFSAQLPPITSNITINGNGQDNTIISGSRTVQIFNVNGATASLTLSSLSLTDGRSDFISGGGAIQVTNNGTLTINDSTLSNNVDDINGLGGAIYSNAGTVTISDSALTANTAFSSGGNFTSLAPARGGAIYSKGDSTITINNSTLTNNLANTYSQASSINSDTGVANGGAIFSIGSTLTVNNSTMSNNSAQSKADFYVRASGGATYSKSSTVSINNSTISSNFIRSKTRFFYTDPNADGGAVYSEDDELMSVTNSIITGNSITLISETAQDGFFQREGLNEIWIESAVSAVIQNNVLGDAKKKSTDFIAGFMPSTGDNNLYATYDKLRRSINQIISPLADNGGNTLTHALTLSSPALNSGSNLTCETIDQRGKPRDDGFCDIGAFEAQPDDVLESAEEESFFVVPLSNGKSVIFDL